MMKTTLLVLATLITSVVIQLEPSSPGPQPSPMAKQFAIVFMESEQGFSDRTGPNSKAYWEKWKAYVGRVQATGKMTGGSALHAPATGKVLGTAREVSGDKIRVSGYLVVNAESLQEAVELAEGSPAIVDGGAVEVRPILPMEAHAGGIQ